MTCKIERHADGHHTTLRLIGYVQAEHLETLRAQLESNGPRTVLDLDEVTLGDVEVVRFLGTCEQEGTALLHCPPSIRGVDRAGTAAIVHPRHEGEHIYVHFLTSRYKRTDERSIDMPRAQHHGAALIIGAASGLGATYEPLGGIEAVAPRRPRA